jgi:hypothetical protein
MLVVWALADYATSSLVWEATMMSGDSTRRWIWARVVVAGTLLFASFQLAGCREDERMMVEDVKAMIQEELPVGSGPEQIKEFFEAHGLRYVFDRYHSPPRYSSMIRNVSRYVLGHKSIRIFLYVDEQGRFTSSEVNLVASAAP